MNTIGTLERALQITRDKIDDHSRYGSPLVLATFKDQEKALTEAIESLKCDKLSRVRERVMELAISPRVIDDPDPCAVAFNEALYQVSQYIDQLDKEQA